MPHHLIMLQLGSTAIGVTTPQGVVLAVEKRLTSPLLVGGRDKSSGQCADLN
jgi:20S proteasome alpha/beta subunit